MFKTLLTARSCLSALPRAVTCIYSLQHQSTRSRASSLEEIVAYLFESVSQDAGSAQALGSSSPAAAVALGSAAELPASTSTGTALGSKLHYKPTMAVPARADFRHAYTPGDSSAASQQRQQQQLACLLATAQAGLVDNMLEQSNFHFTIATAYVTELQHMPAGWCA